MAESRDRVLRALYTIRHATARGFIAGCLLLALGGAATAQTSPSRPGADIEIREIRDGVFVVTHSFPWPANSMFVLIGEDHMVLVDTPYTPEATALVLDWAAAQFGARETVAINTGFHPDNLGGNEELLARTIPVYGADRTVQLVAERGAAVRELILGWLRAPENRRFNDRFASLRTPPPDHVFSLIDGVVLTIEGEQVEVIFPGETHTPDNLVVYFPARSLLFGGCMILAGDSVGNTADANMATWADAVASLGALGCETIVPGHGLRFDAELIQHTVNVLHQGSAR
jgi:metallo-beta-lactamase class B